MTAPRLPCNTRVRGNHLSHEPSSSCVHWWRLVCSDSTHGCASGGGEQRGDLRASGRAWGASEGVPCQSRDVAFSFKQGDMQFIRRRMVSEVSASPPVRRRGSAPDRVRC